MNFGHAYLLEEADVQSHEELNARMNADDEMIKHEVASAVPVILTICRLLEELLFTVQRACSHFVISPILTGGSTFCNLHGKISGLPRKARRTGGSRVCSAPILKVYVNTEGSLNRNDTLGLTLGLTRRLIYVHSHKVKPSNIRSGEFPKN